VSGSNNGKKEAGNESKKLKPFILKRMNEEIPSVFFEYEYTRDYVTTLDFFFFLVSSPSVTQVSIANIFFIPHTLLVHGYTRVSAK